MPLLEQYKHTKNDGIYHILNDGILRQKDASLLFDTDSGNRLIPIKATKCINIYSNVIFDANLLKVALYNGVTINIFDSKTSEYLGSFTPNRPLKSEKLTFSQLEYYNNSKKRLALAKDFILAANHNMRLNIRYHNKKHPLQQYEDAIHTIYEIDKKIKQCKEYEKILLYEAQSKYEYYSCFDNFISGKNFQFNVRSKKPPKNEMNAMISFGNTLLYNTIALEINKTELDIRIGFLHATNKRKNSLNLDIADVFKPLIVDRTIFSLINKRMVTIDCFEKFDNGAIYLNKKGKEIFINAINNKLKDTLDIGGEQTSYTDLIKLEVKKLARHFRNTEKFKAYRQVR